jgi:hypothetical protein
LLARLLRRRPCRHDRAPCRHPYHGRQWGWICGFYPGSEPGEFRDGTAATFDQARAGFAVAWQRFSAKRTDADYQAWRHQRDWTTEKYRRFDRGEWTAHDWKPAPEYGGRQ